MWDPQGQHMLDIWAGGGGLSGHVLNAEVAPWRED